MFAPWSKSDWWLHDLCMPLTITTKWKHASMFLKFYSKKAISQYHIGFLRCQTMHIQWTLLYVWHFLHSHIYYTGYNWQFQHCFVSTHDNHDKCFSFFNLSLNSIVRIISTLIFNITILVGEINYFKSGPSIVIWQLKMRKPHKPHPKSSQMYHSKMVWNPP